MSVTETQALNRAEIGRALGHASHLLSEKELAPDLVAEAASREQGKRLRGGILCMHLHIVLAVFISGSFRKSKPPVRKCALQTDL